MSAPLGAAGFADLVPVSRETLARLETYLELLQAWSARINLVGRDTLADPWRRHILDSAQLLQYLPEGTTSLADIGSGAGFPGLVLAILGIPGIELVEADTRKCAFLREAARITGTSATIHNGRSESVAPHVVDVVTARAVAPLARLLEFAKPFLGPRTVCLFLKGERIEEELTTARNSWTMRAERFGSCSDPRGVILRLEQVVPESRSARG